MQTAALAQASPNSSTAETQHHQHPTIPHSHLDKSFILSASSRLYFIHRSTSSRFSRSNSSLRCSAMFSCKFTLTSSSCTSSTSRVLPLTSLSRSRSRRSSTAARCRCSARLFSPFAARACSAAVDACASASCVERAAREVCVAARSARRRVRGSSEEDEGGGGGSKVVGVVGVAGLERPKREVGLGLGLVVGCGDADGGAGAEGGAARRSASRRAVRSASLVSVMFVRGMWFPAREVGLCTGVDVGFLGFFALVPRVQGGRVVGEPGRRCHGG